MMKNTFRVRRKLILEGLLALIIAISPFIFYSYKYVPQDKEVISILFFDVSSHGFHDASYYLYYLGSKIAPLILLIIWFITSKNWWYHALLIPISMYAFQLFTVIYNENFAAIDENEILYILAITAVIVPVVYFIRVKLVDKYVHGIDLKAMDTELQILKEKEELRKEREKLEQRQETLAKKS